MSLVVPQYLGCTSLRLVLPVLLLFLGKCTDRMSVELTLIFRIEPNLELVPKLPLPPATKADDDEDAG